MIWGSRRTGCSSYRGEGGNSPAFEITVAVLLASLFSCDFLLRFSVVERIVCAARRNAGWRHVQAHRNTFEFRAGGRIELHNQRIVPWDDVALVRRKCEQPVKALQHFSDMEGRCKRPATCHVLVEMSDVGGEHDKSAAGLDPDELKPPRMAAHPTHPQPGANPRLTPA